MVAESETPMYGEDCRTSVYETSHGCFLGGGESVDGGDACDVVFFVVRPSSAGEYNVGGGLAAGGRGGVYVPSL